MYIVASIAPDCRSARNNLYSGISLVHQVRSLITVPCSVSLCFWSFPVFSISRFLVSSFSRFTFSVSRFPFHVSRFKTSNPTLDPVAVRVGDSGLPFAAAIPIPQFASAIPISDPDPVSGSRFRFPFPVPISGPHFQFPFPVPVPVLVPAPRGSASRCLPLCSRAALLYKESST